ncbi:hypothetical protein ILUMI_21900, partial [Ignelater luminosus]
KKTEDVPALQEWLNRKDYQWLSHNILNKYIGLLASKVLENIRNFLKEAKYSSIVIDETSDISIKEQMSFCFRVVDNNFNIHELFVGFYETTNTDASNLFNIVKVVILRFHLSFKECRGQCYDGASNMSGSVTGIQTRVKEVEPPAVFVHCLAHSLNLDVQDALKELTLLRNFLNVIKDLIGFVQNSPKRLHWFKSFYFDGSTLGNLQPFCPRLWCVRILLLKSDRSNYKALIHFLTISTLS